MTFSSSAAQTQMNELEEKGFIVDGTRKDVVNNQVCVVTYKDSDTASDRTGRYRKCQKHCAG